ncbi:MAG TPA: hypothetical protein VFZ33_12495 [Chitinophagaceae bacterium]
MLSLLIAHIIITACCFWSGSLFYKLISKENVQRPMILYLISGLISLTILAQVIALFFPLGSIPKLVLAAILVLSVALKWNDCKNSFKKIVFEFSTWSILSLLLFLLAWVIILLINAGPTMMDDTESYHIQSIKWIQEYGSVPGLVNLHERFGFNSSWFSSVALFSFSSKTTGGFTVLNSILSMWVCFWSISKYNQYQKVNNAQASFAVLIILIAGMVIWPLIRGNAATANYDFITTAVTLILFTEIFFNEKFFPSIEWMIWPVYLFTVRVINFPILILSLFAFIIFIKQKNIKAAFLPVICCLLLIVPFLIRNIIIAGFPFYPATYLDITSVDWKPDPLLTESILEYIKYYNRVSTTYLEIVQTKALGSDWIPTWFKYLFLFDKILVIAGLTGILLASVKLFTQKKDSNKSIIIGVMIAWLICWLLVSPDPRFVYGVLLFGVFLLAYHLIYFIKGFGAMKFLSNVLTILMLAVLSYYIVSKPWRQKEYRNWLAPLQLPQPPVKEIVVDGITFRIPGLINNNWNTRCYGTDLPCLYKIDQRLKARGKNIRSGFHLEK